MLFVIWFAWYNMKGRQSGRLFYFEKAPGIIYPVLIVLTLSLAMVLDPLTNLLPMPEKIEELFALLSTKDIYTLLLVCILGPVLEELLFRGIILDGFLKRYKPAKAIFWSAFLFGLFHLNPWQFIPGFLIGILLAWIYFKTRSLIPVILVHLVNNSLSYFVIYIYGEDIKSFRDLFTEAADYRIFLLFASMLTLLGLVLLYRMLKPFNPFQIINHKME
ncbi:MAG: CPBP family intramembrane metalloprotease [Bacteroidales bacterium]|nr:CPBP family intramembrane metalloprotease [Bacteroidales bacterium]